MMDVRSKAADGVEPETMNEIEVADLQLWRMRSEVVDVPSSAAAEDHERSVASEAWAFSQASPSRRACASAETVADSPA